MQTLRLSEKTCAFLRVTKSSTEQHGLLPCRRHRLILYIALQEQLLAVSVDCRLGTALSRLLQLRTPKRHVAFCKVRARLVSSSEGRAI